MSLETKLDDGNLFIKYTGYSLFRKLGAKEMAEVQKEEMGFPMLGQKAPEFEAVTRVQRKTDVKRNGGAEISKERNIIS